MLGMDVWSDIACPWCYIGTRFLARALGDWDGPPVHVRHRAFELRPDLPPRGVPFRPEMERKFGGSEALAAALEQVTAAGAAAGIEFRMDRIARAPNTRLAHRVIALSREGGDEGPVVDALFAGYFCEGRDVGDPDTLRDLVAAAGLADADALVARALAGEGDASVADDEDLAGRIGATAVPVFVAGGRRGLVGAHPPEHLRDLLSSVA